MKLLRSVGLVALILVTLNMQSLNSKRPWLVFVYMAADNSLWQEADVNINQMVQASKTANAYIVVDLHIKRSGQQKESQLLLIENGQIVAQGANTAEDSGDYHTLIKSLSTTIANFPADHILVDLWNHGSGPLNRAMMGHRGVCYDDSTGHYMTDRDYKQAFDTIVNQSLGGKKIDIIAFDACLMADVEVAYTLQPYANYLVSSQQTVPGPGYNYTTVLDALASTVPSALSFAHSTVQSYDNYYKPSQEAYTLSAVNLSKITSLTQSIKALATLLNGLLASDTQGTLANGLYSCSTASNMPQLDEPTYLDFYTLCSNIYLNAPTFGLSTQNLVKLKNATRNCMSALSQAVFANVHNSGLSATRGLSIYFADVNNGMEPSYTQLYWSAQNPAWLNFLNSYLATFN